MPEQMKLSRPVSAPAVGRRIETLDEALRLIQKDLPKERRRAPHWRHTREMLNRALRARDPVIIEGATRQLERALRKEEDAEREKMKTD
jgi:hypothetical protein